MLMHAFAALLLTAGAFTDFTRDAEYPLPAVVVPAGARIRIQAAPDACRIAGTFTGATPESLRITRFGGTETLSFARADVRALEYHTPPSREVRAYATAGLVLGLTTAAVAGAWGGHEGAVHHGQGRFAALVVPIGLAGGALVGAANSTGYWRAIAPGRSTFGTGRPASGRASADSLLSRRVE